MIRDTFVSGEAPVQDKIKEGVKYDTGKERFDLIPVGPLAEIARVYSMGAQKYEDNNWRKGIKWGRVFASTMRHLWKFWSGEERDEESGLHHLAHAAWNCITLLEYTTTHRELDDRAKGQPYATKEDKGRVSS